MCIAIYDCCYLMIRGSSINASLFLLIVTFFKLFIQIYTCCTGKIYYACVIKPYVLTLHFIFEQPTIQSMIVKQLGDRKRL